MNRIIELSVTNFKRIKVATIRPDIDSHVVRISGDNASGKSSILDAIQTALVGPKAMPAVPVRVGEDMAEINMDCGDVVIRRRITPDGHGTLKITTKDGMSPSKPQTWLDERIGAIAFDPLSFLDQDGKAQAETIRRLASCDVSDLDAEHQRLFEERTNIKRDLRNAEGARGNLLACADGVPDEELVASGVLAAIEDAQKADKVAAALEGELNQARVALGYIEDQMAQDAGALEDIGHNEEEAITASARNTAESIDREQMRLDTLDAQTRDSIRVAEQRLDNEIEDLEAKIAGLREQRRTVGERLRDRSNETRATAWAAIEQLRATEAANIEVYKANTARKRKAIEDRMAVAREKGEALREKATRLQAERDAMKVPDVMVFRQQLRSIEQTNAQVRIKAQWKASDKRIADLQAEVSQRTERLDQIAAERQARIAAVKYPIDGLGFNDDGLLTFGGLPLEQASQAEQIRVSMAIGLALKPELRVVLLRDASLLDKRSLAVVYEEAARADAQVWVERCDVSGVDGEVIIEDGEVVGSKESDNG